MKAAFRKGADAPRTAYAAEQKARVAGAIEAWKAAGGKYTELPGPERARLVKAIPNPSLDWIKQAGLPAKKVLVAYMDAVRATGFSFPRDFDKE